MFPLATTRVQMCAAIQMADISGKRDRSYRRWQYKVYENRMRGSKAMELRTRSLLLQERELLLYKTGWENLFHCRSTSFRHTKENWRCPFLLDNNFCSDSTYIKE
jgi:hypothetical protein